MTDRKMADEIVRLQGLVDMLVATAKNRLVRIRELEAEIHSVGTARGAHKYIYDGLGFRLKPTEPGKFCGRGGKIRRVKVAQEDACVCGEINMRHCPVHGQEAK